MDLQLRGESGEAKNKIKTNRVSSTYTIQFEDTELDELMDDELNVN